MRRIESVQKVECSRVCGKDPEEGKSKITLSFKRDRTRMKSVFPKEVQSTWSPPSYACFCLLPQHPIHRIVFDANDKRKRMKEKADVEIERVAENAASAASAAHVFHRCRRTFSLLLYKSPSVLCVHW
ncbi:hypothetical protein [Phaffia rhodozyma]|uniref:Uncharacterized protein n=1 Tax=Phaffia rhodozyma TaxID=264483 RepID=A0A0F7SVS8_PHARH|nr:hypothetical protein [Phaffia rhodozyma]